MLIKKLNSYSNAKQPSGADLPLIPKTLSTQRYETDSTEGQGTITLNYTVDQSNLDNFWLFIDGKLQRQGSSNDYVFSNIAADNTSSQIVLASPLTAGINIVAMKIGVVKENFPNASSLQAQIARRQLGVNYILNGNGDGSQGTFGWNGFVDAASTQPTDGTGGGTPNITFAVTTVGALRMGSSFLVSKDASNRQGQGWSYDFDIDPADCNASMTLRMDCKGGSGYASGNITASLYDVTNGGLLPGNNQSVPSSGPAEYTFVTNSSTRYRLILFCADSGTTAWTLMLSSIQFGTGRNIYGVPGSDPASFVPTGSWVSNVTYTGKRWRLANREYFDITVLLSGAPTSATLTLNLPVTVDPDSLADGTDTNQYFGGGNIRDAGTGNWRAIVRYSSTTTVEVAYELASGDVGSVTQAAPMTFASGDRITLQFSVPVVGYKTTTVLTDSRVEYAYNSATADSDDTSSFAYGSDGVAIGSFTTAERTKRVRFANQVQSTDHVFVEVQENSKWIKLSEHELRAQNHGTVRYGIRVVPVSGSTTDFDVKFGNGGGISGASYAAAGTAWSSFSSLKWRLVKSANALAVETPGTVAGTVVLSEQQTSGTNGGTFTSGAWRTRTLNTLSKESSDIGWVSLNSNQFTLQPGRYEIEARAPALACAGHLAKLRNITDGMDSLMGSSTYNNNTTQYSQNDSVIVGTLILTAAKTFEIQHQCTNTSATVGLGNSTGLGTETYTTVKIRKKA